MTEKNEEITKLKEENSKLLSEIMSLQERLEKLLEKNINYNKEISNYISKINELEKNIEILKSQNEQYNKFKELFQNENPEEMMMEFKIKSEGNQELFSDYENIRLELKRVKVEKENFEKLYKELLYNNLIGKKDNKLDDLNISKLNSYKNQIIELQNELNQNKNYKIENEILHNTLYQLYNLLFEGFRLDKNIKIDKKYKYIKKEDFTPRIFSSVELSNYIKLMIKSMKESTAEQELRETVVYANMLIRAYLPEKLNMRFKPVEILCEIKKMIDNNCMKLNKIEGEYRLALDKIRNLENEINIMRGKMKQDDIKNEKYQKIVEKVLTKDKIQKEKYMNLNINKRNNSDDKKINKINNKVKINASVECGRKRIIPREKYFIIASQKK